MQRNNPWFKVSLGLLSTLLLGLLLCLLVLLLIYPPEYIYRWVAWAYVDEYDHQKFPSQPVANSNPGFYFAASPDTPFVTNLFSDRIARLDASSLNDYLTRTGTLALIIIQNDTILYENYFNGWQRESLCTSQSVSKSFVSVLLGIALDEGFIESLDEPITRYLPELAQRDPRFQRITLKHLVTMSSGIGYRTAVLRGTNIELPWDDNPKSYYHPNLRRVLLEEITVGEEPGTRFHYNNYNTMLLGLIIERATSRPITGYLEEKIWQPLGMEYPASWSMDSEKDRFIKMSCGLNARPIDYARFGRLILNEGLWLGRQLIPRDWVHASTAEDTSVHRDWYPAEFTNGCEHIFYKYFWWGHANCDSTASYFAAGNLGQNIYIVPHRNLIIVRFGNSNALYSSVQSLWGIERRFHRTAVFMPRE